MLRSQRQAPHQTGIAVADTQNVPILLVLSKIVYDIQLFPVVESELFHNFPVIEPSLSDLLIINIYSSLLTQPKQYKTWVRIFPSLSNCGIWMQNVVFCNNFSSHNLTLVLLSSLLPDWSVPSLPMQSRLV